MHLYKTARFKLLLMNIANHKSYEKYAETFDVTLPTIETKNH